jgi:hypothetical protein
MATATVESPKKGSATVSEYVDLWRREVWLTKYGLKIMYGASWTLRGALPVIFGTNPTKVYNYISNTSRTEYGLNF